MGFYRNIYIDKELISDLYEDETKKSPMVSISRTEGLGAGVKALFLSGSATSSETKTYKLSTRQMVKKLTKRLSSFDLLECEIPQQLGGNSKVMWVTGALSVQETIISTQERTLQINDSGIKTENIGKAELKSVERYFCITDKYGNTFPLITTADYFSSNIFEVMQLAGTVVEAVNFKVKALLRILPAKTSFKKNIGWVAIPIIIEELGS